MCQNDEWLARSAQNSKFNGSTREFLAMLRAEAGKQDDHVMEAGLLVAGDIIENGAPTIYDRDQAIAMISGSP